MNNYHIVVRIIAVVQKIESLKRQTTSCVFVRHEPFAPIHARFAFTDRTADPHTDPEVNYRAGQGEKDRPGQEETKQNKKPTLQAEWPRAFTHEWLLFLRTGLGCMWRGNSLNKRAENKWVVDKKMDYTVDTYGSLDFNSVSGA